MATPCWPAAELRSRWLRQIGNNAFMNTQPMHFSAARLGAVLTLGFALAGCEMFQQKPAPEPQAPPPPPAPVIHEPVATHQFELEEGDDVVGVLQVTRVQGEDTFSDIARRFNLGYEEMVRANPGVDPWVPGVAALSDRAGAVHLFAAVLLALVLVIHIGAALKHALIDRDDVLERMTIGR